MKEFGLDSSDEVHGALHLRKLVKEKVKKKKKSGKEEEEKMEDKIVVEENTSDVKDIEMVTPIVEEEKEVTKVVNEEDKVVTKTVKLVFGDDIRWAQLPVNCSIRPVRDIVRDRFPSLKGVLVKYKDPEGDLVTITTTDEVRFVELLFDSQGFLRLYIAEVSPDQEPAYDGIDSLDEMHKEELNNVIENGEVRKIVEVEQRPTCFEDWIIQFTRLFKNHVGFDSDSYLNLHELGMKLYSDAMEDTVTSEEAQDLFEMAAENFQEMAALAVFNWGNVHLSRARKWIFFPEDSSRESILAQVKVAYEWGKSEYIKAGRRYEEALKIKPDFYEGLLALGQQQFEQAKLCWYCAIGNKIDLGRGPAEAVLELYNKVEYSMEKGRQIWEELREQHLNGLAKYDKYKASLQKMGLDGLFKYASPEEAAEQAANMCSQIYLLWGTLLYERSVIEYKLELPTWEECLEIAVEKFELAGASHTDIAVMIKNHCSNGTSLEGFGFKIDEITGME